MNPHTRGSAPVDGRVSVGVSDQRATAAAIDWRENNVDYFFHHHFIIIIIIIYPSLLVLCARTHTTHTLKYAIARISYTIQVDSSGMFIAYPHFFRSNILSIQIPIFEIFEHTKIPYF